MNEKFTISARQLYVSMGYKSDNFYNWWLAKADKLSLVPGEDYVPTANNWFVNLAAAEKLIRASRWGKRPLAVDLLRSLQTGDALIVMSPPDAAGKYHLPPVEESVGVTVGNMNGVQRGTFDTTPAPAAAQQVDTWVTAEILYDPAVVGIFERDVTNRRRYQIHRTPGANNQESPWLSNEDELESWLMVRGACKDKRWNLEVKLPSTASLIFIDRSNAGGKRIYQYIDGPLDKISGWLDHGAHLGVWLKGIGARFVEPEPQLPPGATCGPVEPQAGSDKPPAWLSPEREKPYVRRLLPFEDEAGDPPAAPQVGASRLNQAASAWLDEMQTLPPPAGVVTPAAEAVVDADTGELIPREIDGFVIHQRAKDGYVNATAMCKAAGKDLYDYKRLDTTKEFLKELEGSPGIPGDPLMIVVTTGLNDLRGTWIHPDMAVNLAQWCSAKFAVAVSRWVRDWLTTGKAPTPPAFQIPTTLAGALRLAADTSEANEQLKLENAQLVTDLDVKEEQLEVAVTEKQEVQQYNAELLFELDKANQAVSMWDFFTLTINVLGMTRPIGFKLCRHYGILNKATENQWGLEETLPCAEWAGKGYFTLRYPKVVIPIKDQNGKKTGEVHKVPRKTAYTTPDRKDADGAVEKVGGFVWLLDKLYHDERCLLYRLVQQYGGRDGLLRPLYGCVVEWCKDSEIPPHPKLRHDIIRLYKPAKSKGETMWRAARQIESKQYIAEGITHEETLKSLSAMMPKDAPRPLTANEDDEDA